MADSSYLMSQAGDADERARLRSLEDWLDPSTTRSLDAAGVREGMRCLEAGAGGGSIARWLAERVGASGTVLATDIDPRFLGDLPSNVEIRRHDLMADDLEPGGFDVVHCRALLQHVSDPHDGLQRLAAAVAPGGWLVVEEGDFGLLTMAGSDSARTTRIAQGFLAQLAAAGVMHSYLGRRLPGMVHELGWANLHVETDTGVAMRGSPAYELLRLGWPEVRLGAAAAGVSESDLALVDAAFETESAPMVAVTSFAVRAHRPDAES